MRRLAACALGVAIGMATGSAPAATGPRIIPDHDMSGVYRISQKGRPDQTWRVRFLAAGEKVRATSLSGTPTALTVLLDIPAGRAELVLESMHALVDVPGLSGVIGKVTDEAGARFTALGEASIAGHRCTRYLVLRKDGSGTVCVTKGGVVLEAHGQDRQGGVSVTALSVREERQPEQKFVAPAGYSHVMLPPQLLAQLLGG